MLFGDGGGAHERDRPGVVSKIIRGVLARAAAAEREGRRAADDAANRGADVDAADARRAVRHRFALAAWEMRPNGDVVDLFDPTGAGRGFVVTGSGSSDGSGDRFGASSSEASSPPFRATSVEIASAEEAEAALAVARRASANWTLPEGSNGAWAGTVARSRANLAHAFARLTVVREPDGTVAECHFVDLVGSQPLGLGGGGRAGTDPAWDRERRLAAGQLLAFSRVVDELSKRRPLGTGRGDDNETATRVLSARDSRLTRTLAPLMAAGARTFMLACVSPLDADYLDTLNTLRVARRTARVEAACVRRTVGPERTRALSSKFESLRRVVEKADAAARAAAASEKRDAPRGARRRRRDWTLRPCRSRRLRDWTLRPCRTPRLGAAGVVAAAPRASVESESTGSHAARPSPSRRDRGGETARAASAAERGRVPRRARDGRHRRLGGEQHGRVHARRPRVVFEPRRG